MSITLRDPEGREYSGESIESICRREWGDDAVPRLDELFGEDRRILVGKPVGATGMAVPAILFVNEEARRAHSRSRRQGPPKER